jgi:hypothetical protein
MTMDDASITINLAGPGKAPPAVPVLGSQWMLIVLCLVMVLMGVLWLGSSRAKTNI